MRTVEELSVEERREEEKRGKERNEKGRRGGREMNRERIGRIMFVKSVSEPVPHLIFLSFAVKRFWYVATCRLL